MLQLILVGCRVMVGPDGDRLLALDQGDIVVAGARRWSAVGLVEDVGELGEQCLQEVVASADL